MSLTLPVHSDEPHYTFQVELDGATYGFEFLWNPICPGWVLSIYTGDDQPILTGLRVVVDWPLTGRFADSRLFPGALMAVDTTGQQLDPARDDFGSRVLLRYFTAAELAE